MAKFFILFFILSPTYLYSSCLDKYLVLEKKLLQKNAITNKRSSQSILELIDLLKENQKYLGKLENLKNKYPSLSYKEIIDRERIEFGPKTIRISLLANINPLSILRVIGRANKKEEFCQKVSSLKEMISWLRSENKKIYGGD